MNKPAKLKYGQWAIKGGTIINVSDMSDIHLRKSVARVKALYRSSMWKLKKYDNLRGLIDEAERRGMYLNGKFVDQKR